MGTLLEGIQKVVNVTENRTLAIIGQIIEFDPNLTAEVDKDDALAVVQHTERLGSLSDIVISEIKEAARKSYGFVMTQATIELLATIVDVIQAENVLIRKMTFMPVQARHGFIQVGHNVIELVSELVKEHG